MRPELSGALPRKYFLKNVKNIFFGKRERNEEFGAQKIGPVILHERYSFFKEVYADQEVIVSLEISGSSEDASIYQFTHKFYLPDGTHCATAEATGVWIDMMLRKTTTPPDDILVVMNQFKTENTKLLSREDIKALPFRPENIDANLFDLNR